MIAAGALRDVDREGLAALLGQAFEREGWVAEAVWLRRPFADLDDLDAKLRAAIAAATPEQQLALARAHPDLAGRLAVGEQLSAASASEQASAGLDRLTPTEHARFSALNAAYRERFGFPFVVCVRDHTRASILTAFERRLEHDREVELATALDQVARIARLRLEDALGA